MMEDEIFVGYQPLSDQLESFGFSQTTDGWVYQTELLDDQFEVVVRVSRRGDVTGRVLDKELREDYAPLRQKQVVGAFVGQVRDTYQRLLETIRTTCFSSTLLSSEQAQRLTTYLEQTYGDVPARPFSKYPNIYAFRHPSHQKWYALLMSLEGAKLDNQRQGLLDIVNVKVPPDQMATLLARPSVYPSYHMNKKHWISVVLDGQLSDADVISLVEDSRRLVEGKKR